MVRTGVRTYVRTYVPGGTYVPIGTRVARVVLEYHGGRVVLLVLL